MHVNLRAPLNQGARAALYANGGRRSLRRSWELGFHILLFPNVSGKMPERAWVARGKVFSPNEGAKLILRDESGNKIEHKVPLIIRGKIFL